MNVDVYDTYVNTPQGNLLHFDVLVNQGDGEKALWYAEEWLKIIGQAASEINQENCRYCHTEATTPEIERQIRTKGYFIIQMEGCPLPAA